MIGFFLFLKIKAQLLALKNPIKLITNLLLTLAFGVYGWLFTVVISNIEFTENTTQSVSSFLNLSWIVFAVLTVSRMFFPNYTPIAESLSPALPLSSWKRYSMELLADFTGSYFFYALIFLSIAAYNLQQYAVYFLLMGLVVIATAHLLRRLIQYFIEFRLSNKTIIITLIAITTVSILWFVCLWFSISPIWPASCSMVVLFFTGFYVYSMHESRKQTQPTDYFNGKWIYLQLILKNPKVRLTLVIGIILKLILLSSDLYLFLTKGEHIFEGAFFYWLFATPAVLFTYIFNNTWGFWRTLWLRIDVQTGNALILLKHHLLLLMIPMAIDMIITLPIVYYTWTNYLFISVFYVTSSLVLITTSFMWSLLTPRKIASVMQMKGSTSPASIISTMTVVLILASMQFSSWFYLLVPLSIIVGGFSIYISALFYEDWKTKIFEKLK